MGVERRGAVGAPHPTPRWEAGRALPACLAGAPLWMGTPGGVGNAGGWGQGGKQPYL